MYDNRDAPPRGADFVVVGAGSGGAALARRLHDAGASVAIVEAGADPGDRPEIKDPTAWFGLQQSEWDWGHVYQPAAELIGRSVPIPRGKALGGSSAINAMMWYRGTRHDHDRWDAQAPGWSHSACLPAYLACEDWASGADSLRGAGGPLRLERSNEDHPLTRAMIEGGAQMGLPVVDDVNGPEPFGVGLASFNLSDGQRWTSADGYLRPRMGAPDFNVICHARALSILFDGDRATGIRYSTGAGTATLHASKGVILAAGAFETPRLLILSGIGAEDQLASLGLSCRHAARDVGANLQDHPLLRALNFRLKRPFGPVVGNGGGSLTIWPSDPAMDEADVLAFPIQGASGGPALRAAYPMSGDMFAIGLGVMRSHSKGFLRLTGTAPDDPLHIVPNLLADPRDLGAMCRAVSFLLEMVEKPAFAGLFDGYAAPDRRVSGADLEAFVRTACATFYHCCGTARMGLDEDAVTTPRLAVRGTRGLWVADASVIPVIPACHTHAPVTMIGERAAGFILEDA